MTIGETLAEGKRSLAAGQSPIGTRPEPHSSFIDTPALDAALLLAEILCMRREDLIVRGHDPITETDRKKFQRLIERRRNGECVAYILGRKEFRGLEFIVNPNVLVPRPDTETLAEAALEYIDSRIEKDSLSLLDLCTGSGALAISLKNERPLLSVTASDISAKALETAAINAARLLTREPLNDKRNTIQLINSDLFTNIAGKFHVIISNPPYVPSGQLSSLAPEVQMEPRLALDGGEDGLGIIKRIVPQARDHLLPDGAILLEAGPDQMPAVRILLETHGFDSIRIHRDLAGTDRVISGRAGGQN